MTTGPPPGASVGGAGGSGGFARPSASAAVADAAEAGAGPGPLPPVDAIPRMDGALRADWLEEQGLLPLSRDDGRVVVACCGDPDPQAVAELAEHLDVPVELRPAPRDALLEAVRAVYEHEASTASELISELSDDGAHGAASGVETHELEGLANEPPVVRLVNLLLSEAVAAGASDVHLEADAGALRARYRIDGVLQDAPSPPARLRSALVSRLKVMAELDIAERRLPQDGRIRLRVEGRELDVRVSTLPTLHGESVVLRLLDAERQRHELDGLGMAEDTLETVRRFAERPQGVLLCTGPTGSGKTTTLYALVDRLRTGREKIVSVEDPVEYELPGVAQAPVRRESGLTFARALRSILRQDPDVLLVGEMRDPETAEICVQASMTGHLVLSTLHTNDAPSALTRLLDLGVPDYLVASTVEVVLAQRLVRTVCGTCGRDEPAGDGARRRMAADGWDVDTVRRGDGCEACRGTGYRGRTGVYELLEVDDETRSELLRRRGADRLRRLARKRGMRPLREDGWRQVARGRTTPEEVLRVTTD